MANPTPLAAGRKDLVLIVNALTLDPDGILWIGIPEGVARLDKDGRWQSYSKRRTPEAVCRTTGSRRWRWAPTARSWVETPFRRLGCGSTRTVMARAAVRPVGQGPNHSMGARRRMVPSGLKAFGGRTSTARQGRPMADLQPSEQRWRSGGRRGQGVGARPRWCRLGRNV